MSALLSRRVVGFVLLVLLAAASAPVSAARIALVIGNGAYQHDRVLPNPRNDADDMVKVLRGLGFEVTQGKDLTRSAMERMVLEFGRKAGDAEIALVYYAGHGLEVGGRNYLLPVDARLPDELALRTEAVDLELILDAVSPARTRLLFLDACRNNPLANNMKIRTAGRSVGRGLARVDAVSNTLIAFATAPGTVAADGDGRNSPFAAALKEHLDKPGLEIQQVLMEVRRSVARATRNQQVPWDSSQLFEPVVLKPGAGGQAAMAVSRADPEGDAWELARQANTAGAYAAYLKEYPKGRYVAAARIALASAVEGTRPATVASAASAEPNQPTGTQTAGRVFRDCPDCPEMVVIPAGSFLMGSSAADQRRAQSEGLREDVTNWEGPQHEVRIGASFALARTEVTVGQFEAFVTATGYRTEAERDAGIGCGISSGEEWVWGSGRSWRDPGFAQGRDHPVVCVSWNDAKEYVRWLSSRTGKGYRLPSEAEWEYAARGGTTSARYWGEDGTQACRYANVADRSMRRDVPGADWRVIHDCDDGASYTAAVGGYAANAFGLHDVLGNAWEWGEDCWNEGYAGAPTSGGAWVQGDCDGRVVRGGGWVSEPASARAAFRSWYTTALRLRSDDTGFRPARMLP